MVDIVTEQGRPHKVSDENAGGTVEPNGHASAGASAYWQNYEQYVDARFWVRPVTPGTKACHIKGWQSESPILPHIPVGPDYGIGLLSGSPFPDGTYLIVVDGDHGDIERLVQVLVPSPVACVGREGRIKLFARTRSEFKYQPIKVDQRKMGEMLGKAHLAVIPPSIHPETKQPYRWVGPSLLQVPYTDLPIVDPRELVKIFGSKFLPDILGRNEGTHDAVLSFSASLVASGHDDEFIRQVISAAWAPDYAGDTPDELDGMIRDARRKFELGQWQQPQGKTNPVTVAARWLLEEWREPGRVMARGGVLMAYGDGWWETLPPDRVRRVVAHQYAGPGAAGFSHDHWAKVAKTAIDLAPLMELPEEHYLVCLQNGTFNLRTGELQPHSPDDRLITQLPFDYDPEAQCPLYERVVRETLLRRGEDGEVDEEETARCINCFEEFAAYTMTPDHRFHKFLVLSGGTRTGKSVLQSVVRQLHNGRCGAVALNMLGNESYRVSLIDMLVNISGEVKVTSYVADDVLKSITAGDPIQLRYLYQELFDTVLPTRLIIAANELFRTSDTSGAIEERMLILPCDNYLEEDKRDPELPDKLMAERAGIFLRMVKAWGRLYERGRFDLPQASKMGIDEFTIENNRPLDWYLARTHEGMKYRDPEYRIPEGLEPMDNDELFLDFAYWMEFQPIQADGQEQLGYQIGQAPKEFGVPPPYSHRIGGNGPAIRVRDLHLLH